MDKEESYSKLLEELSKLIHDIRVFLEENPKFSQNPALLASLIKEFRDYVFTKIASSTDEVLVFSDRGIFPSKETIVYFMRDFYGVSISYHLVRKEIELRASAFVRTHGGVGLLQNNVAHFLERKPKEQIEDIFSMSIAEIERTFNDTKEYPDVLAIKKALPKGFRSLLKGVRKRETAIQKIMKEIQRVRGVHKVYDIFAKENTHH